MGDIKVLNCSPVRAISTECHGTRVTFFAEARLPTEFGVFQMYVFRDNKDKLEHIVMAMGDVENSVNVLARVHSECVTSEVFGSLRCDCRDQLHLALRRIAEEKKGILVYLRQEGRGIGLGNKVRAYTLQDEGFDTYEANLRLGFKEDERKYDIASAMLKYFNVKSVRLMTNNPDKITGISECGIEIAERIPCEVEPNEFNITYLKAKRDKHGHYITMLENKWNEVPVIGEKDKSK